MFPGEVFSHLEFVRFDGDITCFGLPLVRFTTEERLDEIIRPYEENGCPIFNPHRYTLEEGGMKQTDEVQLAFKREADPQGLLNPGKMIAWENPDYDYRTGKTFLFKGLQKAPEAWHEHPRPPRASGRDELQCGAAPADRRAADGGGPRGRRLRSLCRGFRSAADRARSGSPITTRAARTIRPIPMSSGCCAAEALVLSFPVWNYGYPAILKGFFDRVFLPGVSFKLVDGKVRPSLHNIRKVAAVTTYGGSRFRAMPDGRSAAQAGQAHAARDREARRAGVLSRALFDEPVDRSSRARNSWPRWPPGWMHSDALRSSSIAIRCRKASAPALRDAAIEVLAASAARRCGCVDLYAEGFDPVMGRDERRHYNDRAPRIRRWRRISRI